LIEILPLSSHLAAAAAAAEEEAGVGVGTYATTHAHL